MNILSIETATDVCSLSVSSGREVLSVVEETGAGIHSRRLMPLVDKALDKAGLKFTDIVLVAVDKGPGSYTGLRIGVGAAKGFCFSRDLPLVGLGSLKILAQAAKAQVGDENAFYCPMLDARRMEVYFAVFDNQLNEIHETATFIFDEDKFPELPEKKKIYFFGNGMEKGKEYLSGPDVAFVDGIQLSSQYMPSLAMDAYDKGETENIITFEPFYLKDFIAKRSKKLEQILKSKTEK